MIKKFLASSLFLSILIQTIAVDYSFSITAEERLEEENSENSEKFNKDNQTEEKNTENNA